MRVHQVELTQDLYVVREHLEAAEPWVGELTRSTLRAGHWAPRAHPEQVARHIEDAIDGRRRKRLVVITGAGSGIGRATAREFAARGAEVVALDVDERSALDTAAGVNGHAYRLDVADARATEAVAAETRARHGVLDAELREHGIRVTALCPGIVDTNIAKTFTFSGATGAEQAERRRKAARTSRRRGFPPERVAAEVLKAVDNGRVVVPVTVEAQAVHLLNRIAPGLVRRLGRLWRA